jgi:hypothetical protein
MPIAAENPTHFTQIYALPPRKRRAALARVSGSSLMMSHAEAGDHETAC